MMCETKQRHDRLLIAFSPTNSALAAVAFQLICYMFLFTRGVAKSSEALDLRVAWNAKAPL